MILLANELVKKIFGAGASVDQRAVPESASRLTVHVGLKSLAAGLALLTGKEGIELLTNIISGNDHRSASVSAGPHPTATVALGLLTTPHQVSVDGTDKWTAPGPTGRHYWAAKTVSTLLGTGYLVLETKLRSAGQEYQPASEREGDGGEGEGEEAQFPVQAVESTTWHYVSFRTFDSRGSTAVGGNTKGRTTVVVAPWRSFAAAITYDGEPIGSKDSAKFWTDFVTTVVPPAPGLQPPSLDAIVSLLEKQHFKHAATKIAAASAVVVAEGAEGAAGAASLLFV